MFWIARVGKPHGLQITVIHACILTARVKTLYPVCTRKEVSVMSLKKVSASMHFEAKGNKNGISTRRWQNLNLTLIYRPDDIVLAVSTDNALPTREEMEACRSNFFFDTQIANKAEKGYTIWLGVSKQEIYNTSNRTHADRIALAESRGVPEYPIMYAQQLFATEDPLNWSDANATLFQFESPFGAKKLIESTNHIAIPDIKPG